jgi:hypothetical protein
MYSALSAFFLASSYSTIIPLPSLTPYRVGN